MSQPYDIDVVLSYLGPRGCFQIWQMMFISTGGICAQFQLFDVIFIGKYQLIQYSINGDRLYVIVSFVLGDALFFFVGETMKYYSRFRLRCFWLQQSLRKHLLSDE